MQSIIGVRQIADCDYFVGTPLRTPWGRVFGGQTLAQALQAACATVTPPSDGSSDPPRVHSLQAYFVLAGSCDAEVLFEVERARDGGSFQTRSVKALQNNQTILLLQASFHRIERGLTFQADFSEVLQRLSPDLFPRGSADLPSPEVLLQRLSRNTTRPEIPAAFHAFGGIERIDIAEDVNWKLVYTRVEASGVADDEVATHCALLTYLSDYGMVQIARRPHRRAGGKTFDGAPFSMSLSLDHSIHFHRPDKIDVRRWLVFHYFTTVSAAARGVAQLHVFSAATGELLATVVQEALLRVPRDAAL